MSEPIPDEAMEAIEGEVVLSELEGEEPGGTREIRVYDQARGDFKLEIPSECSITFGYFNPAASGMADNPNSYGRGAISMKATALRIYKGKSARSGQLACFLGVDGFRDLSLVLTRLRQRVVIESNFEDDGEGTRTASGREQRQIAQVIEDEAIF